nr:MAG TPA: hypothetical protein [Caudoviricetes sp.]
MNLVFREIPVHPDFVAKQAVFKSKKNNLKIVIEADKTSYTANKDFTYDTIWHDVYISEIRGEELRADLLVPSEMSKNFIENFELSFLEVNNDYNSFGIRHELIKGNQGRMNIMFHNVGFSPQKIKEAEIALSNNARIGINRIKDTWTQNDDDKYDILWNDIYLTYIQGVAGVFSKKAFFNEDSVPLFKHAFLDEFNVEEISFDNVKVEVENMPHD